MTKLLLWEDVILDETLQVKKWVGLLTHRRPPRQGTGRRCTSYTRPATSGRSPTETTIQTRSWPLVTIEFEPQILFLFPEEAAKNCQTDSEFCYSNKKSGAGAMKTALVKLLQWNAARPNATPVTLLQTEQMVLGMKQIEPPWFFLTCEKLTSILTHISFMDTRRP